MIREPDLIVILVIGYWLRYPLKNSIISVTDTIITCCLKRKRNLCLEEEKSLLDSTFDGPVGPKSV